MVLGFLGSDGDVLEREREKERQGVEEYVLTDKARVWNLCERERERIGREGHRDELLLWFPLTSFVSLCFVVLSLVLIFLFPFFLTGFYFLTNKKIFIFFF